MNNKNLTTKGNLVLEKSNSTNNPRIAVYIRNACYSPESYEKQKKLLIGYCKRYFRNSVVDIYEDVNCSGLSNLSERDGFRNLINKIEFNEYDILLVKDINRISRNMDSICDFVTFAIDNGVLIHTLNGQTRWLADDEGRVVIFYG